MKYKVLDSFKAQTSRGEMELQAGQLITLPEEKAIILIKKGKVKSLHKIMTEKYKDFMKWLKSYPVTDVQIRQAMPEHYQALQDTITDMDTCYYREDLPGFDESMEKVKGLYRQAVTAIGREL